MLITERLTPHIKHLPTAALFFGFIFDVFTLNRPDALFENVVIGGYLFLSALTMIALQSRIMGSNENKRLLLLGVLQFSFGNLASALMILYARSGTFTGSAIFIGILALLFIGNEFMHNRYSRTHLRVVIWFILFLTYSTIFVPVLLNGIGALMFLASVAIAIGVTYILILLLSQSAKTSFRQHSGNIKISIVIISIAFSGLYFTNLIPPVPLALKSIGIYHSISRSNGVYYASYEAPQWYEFWKDTNRNFVQINSAPVYCFTSVFAPNDFKTKIRHRWEKYDEVDKRWNTVVNIPFSIAGGRTNGFRGYTQTSQVTNGKWRCNIETSRGTLIGRTTFNVVLGAPKLSETEL